MSVLQSRLGIPAPFGFGNFNPSAGGPPRGRGGRGTSNQGTRGGAAQSRRNTTPGRGSQRKTAGREAKGAYQLPKAIRVLQSQYFNRKVEKTKVDPNLDVKADVELSELYARYHEARQKFLTSKEAKGTGKAEQGSNQTPTAPTNTETSIDVKVSDVREDDVDEQDSSSEGSGESSPPAVITASKKKPAGKQSDQAAAEESNENSSKRLKRSFAEVANTPLVPKLAAAAPKKVAAKPAPKQAGMSWKIVGINGPTEPFEVGSAAEQLLEPRSWTPIREDWVHEKGGDLNVGAIRGPSSLILKFEMGTLTLSNPTNRQLVRLNQALDRVGFEVQWDSATQNLLFHNSGKS